ncbi:hypothetical protein BCR35DRAFT_351602 [Leucosporidium creatinivorum]|uniref:Uncharacterized protein n=1 Tax=Leucosporidium creatinivorum TaxID=106004 RepID=A0A1Y2FR53_9BASI|nr:hypothetical protein BCR35DRAFT_351602 [Leucosporidium creatinivorum]
MPYSNLTLFYGLWVKTWSLVFAAEAYAKVQPALLAIDLISLRRRQGKLVAEAQDWRTTARDLPEEVWEFIKQELIDEALWDEELAVLRKYRCGPCPNAAGDIDGSESWEISSSVIEEGRFWFDFGQGNAQQLLALFGLHMPTAVTWKEASEWNDFDELSAIAIPLQATKNNHSGSYAAPAISIGTDICSNGYDVYPNTRLAVFSPEALRLPSNAELRFRRLISTYRLQVVDCVKSTITSSSPPSSATEAPANAANSQLDEYGEEEPRWMLWSLAEPWD